MAASPRDLVTLTRASQTVRAGSRRLRDRATVLVDASRMLRLFTRGDREADVVWPPHLGWRRDRGTRRQPS